jgi:hypothetical protein
MVDFRSAMLRADDEDELVGATAAATDDGRIM